MHAGKAADLPEKQLTPRGALVKSHEQDQKTMKLGGLTQAETGRD
jgi:hypothetical protein